MSNILLATAIDSGLTFGDVGQLASVLIIVYYFLRHIDKKDSTWDRIIKEWIKAESERLKRIEEMNSDFDATVRLFQADLRTMIDQMMELHTSTIKAVAESSRAITEAKQAIMDMSRRVDGLENRLRGNPT